MLKNLFGSSKRGTSLPDPETLLKAMHSVALADTPENRGKLYHEFLKSWLWICVQELPEGFNPGTNTLSAGANIPVVTPTNAKGVRVLPAFTDPQALANYDPNTPSIALSAIEVFKIAVNTGVAEVAVNAFDPVRKPIRPGGIVTRREFEALANGLVPHPTPDGKGQVLTVKKPMQIQIGACTTPIAAEMKERLISNAARFPEVTRIFRYRMKYVETGTVSDVLGIVCDPPSARFPEIADALMAGVQPLIPRGQSIDLAAVRESDLLIMEKHGELVYEK